MTLAATFLPLAVTRPLTLPNVLNYYHAQFMEKLSVKHNAKNRKRRINGEKGERVKCE